MRREQRWAAHRSTRASLQRSGPSSAPATSYWTQTAQQPHRGVSICNRLTQDLTLVWTDSELWCLQGAQLWPHAGSAQMPTRTFLWSGPAGRNSCQQAETKQHACSQPCLVPLCFKRDLLVRHGLEARGVGSSRASVVWYVALRAAACPGEHSHIPAGKHQLAQPNVRSSLPDNSQQSKGAGHCARF